MTIRAAVVELRGAMRPSLPAARRQTFAGAWLVSGAMLLSGGLIYAFHVLAAQTLGPAAYGEIAVLWAALFLSVIVLFRPLEQTTSRAIANRLARGDEVRTVLRSIAALTGVALLAVATVGAIAWAPLGEKLFGGSSVLTGALLVGIAAYGVAYVARGILGGMRWFGGYALGLTADAITRLALAAPLLAVASKNVAAIAVAGAGAAGAVAPIAAGRGRIKSLLRPRAGAEFRLRAALTFAAPASVIAIADQVLVNAGPLLVVLGGGTTETAGVVFAATMLVRVPVYLFQGLAASLLPNLTLLQAVDRDGSLRPAVLHATRTLLVLGALIVAGAAALGPEVMTLLYGDEFAVGRLELVVLAAGVGCYLGASTLSQALLALDRAGRSAACWLAAAATFLSVYAVVPGAPLSRISAGFAAATLLTLVLLAVTLRKTLRR